MAHFAELDENNQVLRVIVVANSELLDENGDEQEALGAAFCTQLFGGTWKQTSYTGSFRKNYAGVDYTYDPNHDAFVPPRPYPSWVLDKTIFQWEAPVPKPADTFMYLWNEETVSWDRV